jgi:hypothetical protein
MLGRIFEVAAKLARYIRQNFHFGCGSPFRLQINRMVATRNSNFASRLVTTAVGDGQLKFYVKIYHKHANKLYTKVGNRMWGRGLGSCFLE